MVDESMKAERAKAQVAPTIEEMCGKVDRWTRAGNQGKEIYCPNCTSETHVYHFAWSELMCRNCKEAVEKYRWLTP
jgi:hypothetical protein